MRLDPLDMMGKKFKVCNDLDDKNPPRDFYNHIKPEIDEAIGKAVTFDILFHNSEHQATLFRYGVKKSAQVKNVIVKCLKGASVNINSENLAYIKPFIKLNNLITNNPAFHIALHIA